MELTTRFSIEDTAFDLILKKSVTIMGLEMKHGILSGNKPSVNYYCCVEYYVRNDDFEGWRAEHELSVAKRSDIEKAA